MRRERVTTEVKKSILFIVISTWVLSVGAQDDRWASSSLIANEEEKKEIDYRLSLRAGGIMPDGKVDVMLGQKNKWIAPTLGAEFAMRFHPKWKSLRDYNKASIGVALSFWKFNGQQWDKNDLLGYAIAPYAFVEVPFYTSKHFEIGVRPGIGCSFITKTYYNTATPEQQGNTLTGTPPVETINRSVGSVFNFFFPEALYLNFPIRKGWAIGLAGGWYHMSNGSIRQPNSGYNMFMGELSVTYSPYEEEESPFVIPKEEEKQYIVEPLPDDRKESLKALQKKHCEIELALCGGGREVYYKDKKAFFCSEMQIAAYWRAHKIFRLGGGVDVFYDGAFYDRPTSFKKTYLGGATQTDCWRVGVSLQPEFVMGKFTAGFHFGVYLLDPIKNREAVEGTADYSSLWEEHKTLNKGVLYSYDLIKAGSAGYPDGWLYTQIVLRYRFPYHVFAQIAMKAHLTKVEFVSAGLGVYL